MYAIKDMCIYTHTTNLEFVHPWWCLAYFAHSATKKFFHYSRVSDDW